MGENAESVEFSEYSIWIQVHGLPIGFMSERVVKDIGGRLGTFLSSDPRNFNGWWRPYMRI